MMHDNVAIRRHITQVSEPYLRQSIVDDMSSWQKLMLPWLMLGRDLFMSRRSARSDIEYWCKVVEVSPLRELNHSPNPLAKT